MASRVSKTSYSRKQSCTFCVNKGFAVDVYSTHTVRNAQGKITCNELLNHICGNCNRRGHTKGNCNSTKAKPSSVSVTVSISKDGGKTLSQPLYCGKIMSNRFSELSVIDDDCDDVNNDVNNDFIDKSRVQTKQPIRNYALALSRCVSARVESTDASTTTMKSPEKVTPVIIKKRRILNWADCESDSDDE